MFKDSNFKIYEFIIKTYTIKKIYEIIENSSKHMLKIRKVLNNIKIKFYEIFELMKKQ